MDLLDRVRQKVRNPHPPHRMGPLQLERRPTPPLLLARLPASQHQGSEVFQEGGRQQARSIADGEGGQGVAGGEAPGAEGAVTAPTEVAGQPAGQGAPPVPSI